MGAWAYVSVLQTSLVNRYCQDGFGKEYRQTVGLDFYLKRLQLPGERHITLQIWDIGGQSLTGKMINNYIENADVCLGRNWEGEGGGGGGGLLQAPSPRPCDAPHSRLRVLSCSQGILFVYDITNRASFENLSDWHQLVEKHFAGQSKKPHLALVGNKRELEPGGGGGWRAVPGSMEKWMG